MRIVVIGATGTIGKAVADALAVRHDVVRASRSGQPSVDIQDVASVSALFDQIQPVDAVVLCAPSAPPWRHERRSTCSPTCNSTLLLSGY